MEIMEKHVVLMVDDDKNILDSFQRILRREPYEVRCVSSAAEALKVLASEKVDVVVSDQEMPGMKGVEFLKKVREEYPDTIRYVLTGQPSLDVAIRSINEGAIDRFFTKPCNLIDLAITIRQALQQKELMAKTKRLLHTVKRQSAVIERAERDNPAITRVERDEEGTIVLDDSTTDLAEFIKILDMEIDKAEKHL